MMDRVGEVDIALNNLPIRLVLTQFGPAIPASRLLGAHIRFKVKMV